jgi:hypothetical protein
LSGVGNAVPSAVTVCPSITVWLEAQRESTQQPVMNVGFNLTVICA